MMKKSVYKADFVPHNRYFSYFCAHKQTKPL